MRIFYMLLWSFVMTVSVASCTGSTVRRDRITSRVEDSAAFEKLHASNVGARRHLESTEFATGSQLIRVEKPTFPVVPIDAHLPKPVIIRILLAVSTLGKVYSMNLISSNYHGPYLTAFLGRIRLCVMKWKFNPLVISKVYRDAQGRQMAKENAVTFSARYQFTFDRRMTGGVDVFPARGD